MRCLIFGVVGGQSGGLVTDLLADPLTWCDLRIALWRGTENLHAISSGYRGEMVIIDFS